MKTHELNYHLPKELIATEPQEPCRIISYNEEQGPSEISWENLYDHFNQGDILVVNKTKVIPARVPLEVGDVLFLQPLEAENQWQVLTASKHLKVGDQLALPGGIRSKLIQKGRPQIIETSEKIDSTYFDTYGELAIPPYILKLRQNPRASSQDKLWYQTDWASELGSLAAPTASLHFRQEQLSALKNKGVQILELTLHVGLGTFLPIDAEDLSQHQMHKEWVSVPASVKKSLDTAKKNGFSIFALGTTVIRSLEALHRGHLTQTKEAYCGETDLFLKPGESIYYADYLLTNFHQPQSTLIALVMAFMGVESTKKSYEWAVKNQFRFLSYGDLCLWKKNQ